MAKQAICKLKSISPYSQSKQIKTPRPDNVLAVDHEVACWRERMHVTKDGFVYIPGMAFTKSIAEAAKYLGIPIPGKGKATFTKNFEAGVRALAPLVLDIKAVDVECEEVFVPSDGKRGSGSRVTKYFPYIPEWSGTVTYWIADDLITREAFSKAIVASGGLIGIGRFRPKNLGYYGMFSVENLVWKHDNKETK